MSSTGGFIQDAGATASEQVKTAVLACLFNHSRALGLASVCHVE
jgi:hypothetical protein